MPDEENLVASDQWRTFHRILPYDLHEELKRFESVVAREMKVSEIGLGASIQVWSVITHFLRQHQAELIETAREWRAEEHNEQPR